MTSKIVAQRAGGEAFWKLSQEVVKDDSNEGQQKFKTADLIFEPISVPANFSIRGDNLIISLEAGDGNRRQIQVADLGNTAAFDFLLETLEATTANGQQKTKAVKLVAPVGNGNIIRSDIIAKRLYALEYVEKTAPFAEPLQLFEDKDWAASTSFSELFKDSLGAIRLNDAGETLTVLQKELHNRLNLPLVAAGLKRKTIVILEGGDGFPFGGNCSWQLYEGALALGYDVIAMAEEGHDLQTKPQYKHWSKAFLPVKTGYDAEFPARIAAAVKSYGKPVDGIVTYFESFHTSLAAAAELLGLAHEPVSAYDIATNKYKISEFEGRNSFKASSTEEAIKIAKTEDVPWPIIVKPSRGWASELVFKVNNAEELEATAPRMNDARHGSEFVMEHYCDGPEVDINIVLYDGKVVFWEMGDENPKNADGGAESFGEDDYCLPSELPKSEQQTIYDSLLQTMTKLGFRNGVYHCEARVDNSTMEWGVTKTGAPELVPRKDHNGQTPTSWLIEINTRPGGFNTCDIVQSTYGVDYWSLLLATKLVDNDEVVRALSTPYRDGAQGFADMVFVIAAFDKNTKKGIWESGNVTEEMIRERPDLGKHFTGHFTFPKKGELVPHPSSGTNRFVVYMHLFSRESRAHVLELASEAKKELARRTQWS